MFYGLFFALAYAVPLGLVCLLYGLMLRRLRQRKGPSGSSASTSTSVGGKQGVAAKGEGHTGSSVPITKSSATNERSAVSGGRAAAEGRRSSSKRRVTRLVVVVVVLFAAYWLPFQVGYHVTG